MKTFTVQFKRTSFDDVRTIFVFADIPERALSTARDSEGHNIIILSCSEKKEEENNGSI